MAIGIDAEQQIARLGLGR